MNIEFKDIQKLTRAAYSHGYLDSVINQDRQINDEILLKGWRKWRDEYINSQEVKGNEGD